MEGSILKMDVPLIVSEACVKINERIQEVITDLKIKASKQAENSQERLLLQACITRLEDLNTEVYNRIFNEFMRTMVCTALPKTQIESVDEAQEVIDKTVEFIGGKFSSLSTKLHSKAYDLFQSLDNEDQLQAMLHLLSDPSRLRSLTESLGDVMQQ